MRRKVILPFDDHPYSVMYQGTAFAMGIIQGNATEDIVPWLCGKYINCSFYKNRKNQFMISISDSWGLDDKILFHQQVNLYPELYSALYTYDIIELLRRMIGKGCYPRGVYNEEFVPGKWSYQKKYYAHDFILIGYDDVSQNFLSAGYLEDEKFQRFLIPYESMRMALVSLKTEKFIADFYKYNTDAKYELNLKRIADELTDYICCKTSQKIYSKDGSWGMDALRQLANYFVNTSENKRYLDYRYTRGILEHKFFMQMRIDYLSKNGYLRDCSYSQQAQRVYKMAESVHMLALKYILTGKQEIVVHIHSIINDILSVENDYLSAVLCELQCGLERL